MLHFLKNNNFIVPLVGIGSVLISSAYILYGPSNNRKRKRKICIPGIINMGNNCFLNSVLQALAPCNNLRAWMNDFKFKCTEVINLNNTLFSMLNILNDYYSEEDVISPQGLLNTLRMKRWYISSDQQDAHEMFHVLAETLSDESVQENSSIFISCSPENALYEKNSGIYGKSGYIFSKFHNVSNPLKGLFVSRLQCQHCMHKFPLKCDTFDSISLTLPSKAYISIVLEQLLHDFTAIESITGVKCEFCCDTKSTVSFNKKMSFARLPKSLCLHIHRTMWTSGGMPIKSNSHVSFPELLEMDKFMYFKNLVHPSPYKTSKNSDVGLLGGNNCKMVSPNSSNPGTPHKNSTNVNLWKALNYHSQASISALQRSTIRKSLSEPLTNIDDQKLAFQYNSELSSDPFSSYTYKLVSIIVHLGDVLSGHFVTYRRVPSMFGERFPDKWLYTSDTEVRLASIKEVFSAKAYMLFYEKLLID